VDRNHLNPVRRDNADMSDPLAFSGEHAMNKGRQSLRNRRMHPKQNHSGAFESAPSLNGKLPEISI
jgi:hypothetical protein